MYFSKLLETLDVLQNFIHQISSSVQKNVANVDEIDWNEKLEIVLFYAMYGLKPVGVGRFFTMMAIHQKFSGFIKKELSSKVIWNHLDTFYDMAALHESEIIPFPNEEVDFELSDEFDDLIKEKFNVSLQETKEGNGSSKNSLSAKSAKKLGASKSKQSTSSCESKAIFLTPAAVKPAKSSLDSKTPTTENVPKKQDTPFPAAKTGKVKRSSSPFNPKSTKSEPPSAAKEESNESASSKKASKTEGSATGIRKSVKVEMGPIPVSSKKTAKQEAIATKQAKSEPSDGSSKKGKAEKEVPAKKGRSSSAAESTAKKNSKADKKVESESSKKPNDTSSGKTKSEKNSSSSSKGGRNDDGESLSSSGSRKSSVGKVDLTDKKRKRQKESEKKAVPAKRRR